MGTGCVKALGLELAHSWSLMLGVQELDLVGFFKSRRELSLDSKCHGSDGTGFWLQCRRLCVGNNRDRKMKLLSDPGKMPVAWTRCWREMGRWGYFVEGELTAFADGWNRRGEGKGIRRENT